MIKIFSELKNEFDEKYQFAKTFVSFLPINLSFNKKVKIKNIKEEKNEEYYKWQFLYSLVFSGMYPKENIGTEVFFPKGNKNSAPIKFDGVIFDNSN